MRHYSNLIFFLLIVSYEIGLTQESNFLGEIKITQIPPALNVMDAIYPGPNGTAYAIMYQLESIHSPRIYKANKLDEEFNLIETYKIQNATTKSITGDVLKKDARAEFFYTDNGLNMIYVDDAKSTIRIFTTDVENSISYKELGKFEIADRAKGKIRGLLSSADGKMFAIVLDVDKVDSQETFIVSFDYNLSTKGHYILNHSKNNRRQMYAINNDGVICNIDINDNDPKKGVPIVYYFEFRILNNGGIVQSKSISYLELTGASGILNSDGNQFFTEILCTHKKGVTVKNKIVTETAYKIYHMVFTPEIEILISSVLPLDKSAIEDLKGSGNRIGKVIRLRGSFRMKDGSTILLGDAHTSVYTRGRFDAKGVYTEPESSHIYTGIMIIHLDNLGQVKELKLIDRLVFGSWDYFMPVVPVKVHEEIIFTYFDNKKVTHFMKIQLIEDGSMQLHERTIDQDQLQDRAIVQRTLKFDGTKYVFALIDHPIGKPKALRITMD